MQYIVMDLNRIRASMGAHFDPSHAGEYSGYCPECDEQIDQSHAYCHGCGKPVIWRNSKRWRREHGSPTMRARQLSAVRPESESGDYLMTRARKSGFKNRTEAERWAVARRSLSEERLQEIVDACFKSGDRGRGLIRHAINWALKEAEESASGSMEAEVIG